MLLSRSTTVRFVARRYKEQRTYKLPDVARTVRAEAAARQVLSDAFAPLFGGVKPYISMTTNEGYDATGQDWDAVLAELTTDGLTPERTYVAIYSADPKLLVSYPPTVTSQRERLTVNVEVSSEDEGVVRAATAKLDRLVTAIIAGPEVADAASPALAAPGPTSAETPSVLTPTSEASPPPSETPARSWLARTWRDHAATLVVTVVGTVLAAALLVVLNIGG